jgi:hypothetical protein
VWKGTAEPASAFEKLSMLLLAFRRDLLCDELGREILPCLVAVQRMIREIRVDDG